MAALPPPPQELPSLGTLQAAPRRRHLAYLLIAASLLIFVGLVPFARTQLGAMPAFIPLYQSALIVTDLVTAMLLFGQFRILRSRALFMLTAAYAFTALMTLAHTLSFPGLFAPDGLLSGGSQTTVWLYMFWHGGFPLFMIGYAMQRERAASAPLTHRSANLLGLLLVPLAVAALVLLATRGHDLLPVLLEKGRYLPSAQMIVLAFWAPSAIALALLWRRRQRSVLDLWLAVVMCAWLADVGLSAVFNGGRFDLGFYVGRVYGLIAASLVLIVLLTENGQLYQQLSESLAGERARTTQARQLTLQLERANERLEGSNEELQRANRLKSEFLATMSHELRTPLNAIIGFSELLKDGLAGPMAEKQLRFVGHVHQSGRHLLELINDILDLSKIEAGKLEIQPEPVEFEALLEECLAMMREKLAAKELRYYGEVPEVIGTLDLDQRRFKQVLLNLLTNAIKFTPAGGEIYVRARRVDRPRAMTAMPGFASGRRLALPEGDAAAFLEVSVLDTGVGIGEADLGKLFEPFSQIDTALTRKIEGTGLGLAMVHRLVELHGGTVAVTSEPGRGSCFSFWLPWRDHAAQSAPAPVAVEQHGVDADDLPTLAMSPLALLIEDQPSAAALMRVQLEAESFRVVVAGSAEQALQMAEHLTPDVILLDIVLPGMDGWQMLARLREHPRWAEIPVVVVSVVAERGRGFALGASMVMQKPVGRAELAKGLARLGFAPGAREDMTVLVIDDDVQAVELLASYLHEQRHIVLRAYDGREGLDLARRCKPDLIALDLEMPVMNGFEVVEALKRDPATAHLPIIVLTARSLSDADRKRLSGHVLDIVAKADFAPSQLIGEVRRALYTAAR